MLINFKFQAEQKIAFGNSDEAYRIACKNIFKIKIWKIPPFSQILKRLQWTLSF